MKQLWAPWRIEYITGEKEDGCVFCDAATGEPSGELVLFTGSLSTVILNKYPYNSAHLLISPIRHTNEIDTLSVEESTDIFRLVRHSVTVLKKALKPDGFNVGMNLGKAAGAGIDDHLHMHVVPRWTGDTNFMPVLSDTRVMPEHLSQTAATLKPYFERI